MCVRSSGRVAGSSPPEASEGPHRVAPDHRFSHNIVSCSSRQVEESSLQDSVEFIQDNFAFDELKINQLGTSITSAKFYHLCYIIKVKSIIVTGSAYTQGEGLKKDLHTRGQESWVRSST